MASTSALLTANAVYGSVKAREALKRTERHGYACYIASNGNTLRGHQTEFRLLHVKRLISDYARVVILARTTEWPLALADQGGPVDSTVQLL